MLSCLSLAATSTLILGGGDAAVAPGACPLLQGDTLDGYTLVHGDILVPREYFDKAGYAVNRWQGGLVRYFVEDSVSRQELSAIRSAMGDWEAVASVSFVEVDFHTAPHVHVREMRAGEEVGAAGFSGIGQPASGYDVAIRDWSARTLRHELGHTLGYFHEQERPDRDQYVSIHWDHMDPTRRDQFEIEPSAGTRTPYDLDSIMHYWSCAFSRKTEDCSTCNASNWTIEVLAPGWDPCSFGNSDRISHFDGLTMSFLYPQPNWRFADGNDPASPNTGSFTQPYRTIALGVSGTPTGGTLWIAPGTYTAAATYSKAMTLKSQFRDVVLH